MKNTIYSINGPVVTIKGKTDLEMMEMVYVGKARLVGEVIRMNDKETTIQVYEETGGLKAGEPVESTGGPLSVTLGPGILRNIYDGIQRPLPAIEQHMGSFIERGAHEPSLDEAAKWDVTVTVKTGDTLTAGQIYATCPETPAIQHRCMVPPEVCGTVTWAAENGSYTVNDPIVKLTDAKGREHTLTLCQKWPIRTPRPAAERMTSPRPLITGQRVIDTMFPLAKGGAAAIPGGFGTGKTMTASVIASELGMTLYIVQMDKLITKYMGETSVKLRQIFDAIQHNVGVYLFDEFDAIGADRGLDNEVGEMRRILNSFLQFIEADSSESIVIAATNNKQMLDRALFRRFDDVLHYGLPTAEEAGMIAESVIGGYDTKFF